MKISLKKIFLNSLSRDLFLKMMAMQPSERYTAVQACNHPWITRKVNDSIPMTFEQKNLIFKKEMELNKVIFEGIKICVSL
jgi:serine/threonine protein kinase